ncbi:MAG TPA: hypothetical protein VHS31_05635 [Tepidisphaeraceae bacterium]|nr:hypothetical protein [Tepidisphaeraceae bacterium]
MRKYLRLLRLPPTRRRRAATKLVAQVFRDDTGGEVLEYSLIAGLIVVGAIGMITCVGSKITGKWNSLNNKL